MTITTNLNTFVFAFTNPEDAATADRLGLSQIVWPTDPDDWDEARGLELLGRDIVSVLIGDRKAVSRAVDSAKYFIERDLFVRKIALPDLAEGDDLSVWFDKGHTVDELFALAQATRPLIKNAETGTLISVTAGSITPEEIQWFWPNKIPSGANTVLAADPGAGKSFTALYCAAKVSTGGQWPDDSGQAEKGSVILISDEDDPAKVVVPRLIAHKADLSKIEIVSGVQGDDFFNLAAHLGRLDNLLRKMGDCRLIIIDPITAYMGDANANSNAEVRSILGPFANLAAEHNVTIISITHFNKKAGESYIYRGLGSIAFVAQSRSAWGIVIDKDDGETRILCPIKSNYCINPTGLKFRIIDGAVQFEPEPWTGHIDDTGDKKTGRLDEASDWLQERLGGADIASATIFEEGGAQGFSKDLLYRAKEKLGVRANKIGFGGQWFWRLSDGE